MIEIWKDIPGFEGLYQVSDQGNVRSMDRTVRGVSKAGNEYLRRTTGRILSAGRCRGYLIVNLHPSGTIAVHLLVARAHVPGSTQGLQVNHIDGDKHNNCAGNLEWVTAKQNQHHAVESGLRKRAIRVRDPATGIVYASINRGARAAKCRHHTVSHTWERA